MGIEDRRQRDRAAQRRLICSTARTLAERDGWDAVTTRRLSQEIEYSQPVIYKHFASMEELADAVALEGFAELAAALARARRSTTAAVPAVCRAYTAFARANPALYDAMFNRPTSLDFGDDSAEPLHAAFSEVRAAVDTVAGQRDADTLTEVLWSGLHGLTTLARQHRLRPGHDAARVTALAALLDDRRTAPRRQKPATRTAAQRNS